MDRSRDRSRARRARRVQAVKGWVIGGSATLNCYHRPNRSVKLFIRCLRTVALIARLDSSRRGRHQATHRKTVQIDLGIFPGVHRYPTIQKDKTRHTRLQGDASLAFGLSFAVRSEQQAPSAVLA